jgi:hypothetical protein
MVRKAQDESKGSAFEYVILNRNILRQVILRIPFVTMKMTGLMLICKYG